VKKTVQTVGLKQLKTHLGEYVNMIRRGERIIITDRGSEIAELTPLSESRKTMLALRSSGKMNWNGGKPAGLRGASVKGKPIAETVIENRR
jgi:prevent-host-death family protein